MKRIILTTILAATVGSLTAGLAVLVTKRESEWVAYVTIMVFGNIFFPTLIGVILYQFIRNRIPIGNSFKKFSLHVILLVFVLIVGIFLWTVLDVISYYSDFSGLNSKNLIKDYNSEFRGFMILGLVIAIAIPGIDILLTKKQSSKSAISNKIH